MHVSQDETSDDSGERKKKKASSAAGKASKHHHAAAGAHNLTEKVGIRSMNSSLNFMCPYILI